MKVSPLSMERGEVFQFQLSAWRRERDSNPRYRFRYSGFQDHPFQPLTHPSVRTAANDALALVYNISECCPYRETLATLFYFERPKAREWNCMTSLKCARK